ncbi:DEAD/DEAH box helicase [Metapseudomonas otitidis]|uniref:DEAD/DEAH box helicase n=1 Tax=Metapseudomonas otitidis TaxID=319939 RepID=UPI00260F156A|nr:AAA domain-containing protein [Pseudomonas otitidis]
MYQYVAAGLFVLGATAVAWLLDRETEEERGLHEELERRNAQTRRDYQDAFKADAREQARAHEKAALHLKADYEEYCLRFRSRLQGPAKEFDALAEQLANDLADASISPYRRNALRLLSGRLQDTQNRLEGFFAYCEWYLRTLEKLAQRQQFSELIRMAPPQSRLPDDWFYGGKVVLASVAEIDQARNAYGQRLELRAEKQAGIWTDTQQRALMMQYPDQNAVPVQMIGNKRRPEFFKACVFRGALHAEHILEDVPCMAFVERAHTLPLYGDGYTVRCFPSFCSVDKPQAANSGVLAFLPRSESSFPGKNYPRGDRIEVYVHYYDLLLSKGQVTVTQHPESLRYSEQSTAPVFVHVDSAVHDLEALERESAGAQWQLRGTIEADGELIVSLQLGGWQVEAKANARRAQLETVSVMRTGFDSVELDALPCPVRLIDVRFKDSVFCDALQFEAFLTFCRQQSLFAGDGPARKRAGQFFERWNAVTDYLLAETGHVVFSLGDVTERDELCLECTCTVSLSDGLLKLIERARSTPRLFVEELFLSASGEQRWLQVAELLGAPEIVASKRYEIEHKGLRRPGPDSGYLRVQPAQYRIRFPNRGELANLGRQKVALQGFLGGRLVNRDLQQILLMPDRYVPTPDPFWSERVAHGLEWHDPNWQAPGKATAAKKIIEAALVESNLYLIQGPPGTGKTTCIVELLYQLFTAKPDSRVLVVSQQNTAVDNALDRFLEQFPGFSSNVLRIGNDVDKVQVEVRPLMTESVLMEYLRKRQQDYSLASLENSVKANWIEAWMESIYHPSDQGRSRFDDELAELVVQEHRLIGATCVGLSSRRYGMDRLAFDICIVDEGGRATVPELLIPLMRSRKAIIIGDHFQLPPSIARALLEADAKTALPFLEETFLKTSFFEQLYENLPTACFGRLVEQFRMVEPIGDLVADLFYTTDNVRGLRNGKVHERKYFLDPEHCLCWVDVPHGKEEYEGTSSFNAAEVKAIVDLLKTSAQKLAERQTEAPDSFERKTVAIITPYGAQKRLINKQLSVLRKHMALIDQVFEDIKIDTVDSFQGSEADIVLYSTVRTQGRIRFLLDRQRLNVACSRARENLIFFGHSQFLRRQERGKGALFSLIIDRSVRFTAANPTHSKAQMKAESVPRSVLG